MGADSIVHGFAVGSALLGFWLVVRFPGLGPQRLGPALLLLAGSMLACAPLPALVGVVVAAAGVPAALCLVLLPSLTLLFWTAGCFVRSVQRLLAEGGVR